MIKINLIREGRAPVRGAATGATPSGPGGGAKNANNIIIIALLVIAAALGGGWWFIKSGELKAKLAELEEKKFEAQKLEKIIKEVEDFEKRKDNLEKRIKTIHDLKANQKGPVRVMDRISQDLPDLVWLDKLTDDGKQIVVSGRGLNPNAIAIFIENIKADPMFDEPKVSDITQTSSGGPGNPEVYNFSMKFTFTPVPGPSGGDAAGGQSKGSASAE